MSRSHLRLALGTVASASATPYGYTISLWSSGALLMHFHGPPNVGEVFLFAAGALAGFGIVGGIAHGALRKAEPLKPGRGHLVAGILHWFSVGIAVGSVALVSETSSGVAWALGSLMATTLYLTGAAVQLAFLTRYDADDLPASTASRRR